MPITVLQKHSSVNKYLYYGIALLLVGFQSVNATQGERATQQKKTAAAQKSQPQQSPVSSPSPSQTAVEQPQPTVQAEKSSEQPKTSFWDAKLTDWIQVGINAVLILFVLWQAKINREQRQAMVDQNKIMQGQVEHARITERAYIGIVAVATENQVIGRHPVVRVTVVNGGRTPAYNLKMPGRLMVAVAGTPYPHERPDSSQKATETFLPAGSQTTYNYPFIGPLVPWNAQWENALTTEEYFMFLRVEAQFEDAWGDSHVTPFKLAYRASDGRWGDYKDPKETEPTVEVTP